MEEKQKEKEELEMKKEERIRARLLKKLEKTNKVNKKNKQKSLHESKEEISSNNILRETGLCFSCASECTHIKFGIKCQAQNCQRMFHVACLKKRGVFKDHFRCSVCTLKQKMRE